MKKLLLLSLLVLAGCSFSPKETTPAPAQAPTVTAPAQAPAAPSQGVQTTRTTTFAAAPAYTVQDDYFGPAYSTVTEVQYISQPQVAYETQTYTEQYQVQPTYAGVPQPMYAPQNPGAGMGYAQGTPMQGGAVGPAGTQNQGVNPYYPYNAGGQSVQNPMGSGSVVVLQNPMTRELVRCDFTDYNCIGSYESQGYVQLRAAPHFAGYNDVPSATDYPPRRYRDNNNIPRW